MTSTPNLDLPFILAAQAQKHITHNEALKRLDAIVQLAVKSRTLAAPPASPAEGDRFIVAAGASGTWTGFAASIAAWQDGTWEFFAPIAGWRAWVEAESVLMVYDGAAWIAAGATNPVARVGVNTTADATNKLAVKSDAVLLTHDDVTPGSGNMRVVLNKAAAAGTASLLYQTGFSGRAEMGLTGDDKWRIKVSANGSNWTDAFTIDGATGRIGVGTATPSVPLHVTGALRVGSSTVASLPSASTAGEGALIYVSNAAGGGVIAFSDGTSWRRVTDRTVVS